MPLQLGWPSLGLLGVPFGSGASPMSLSSRAVLCLAGWLGILLISYSLAYESAGENPRFLFSDTSAGET
jgi:hypothetical protein